MDKIKDHTVLLSVELGLQYNKYNTINFISTISIHKINRFKMRGLGLSEGVENPSV